MLFRSHTNKTYLEKIFELKRVEGIEGLGKIIPSESKEDSVTEECKVVRYSNREVRKVEGLLVLTTDLQWSLQFQQDGLAEEDLPGLDAQPPHLRLRHLDNLSRTTSPHWRGRGVLVINIILTIHYHLHHRLDRFHLPIIITIVITVMVILITLSSVTFLLQYPS